MTTQSTVSMNEVTRLLNESGIKATYEMSGGGCGTIYLGEFDSDGMAEFAVGPSEYATGMVEFDDLCWGVDGSEHATYAHQIMSSSEFNPSIVASCIAFAFRNRIRKEVK